MINLILLRKKLLLIVLILIVIGIGVFVSIRQMQLIDQLKAQGKDYNVGFATVTPENGKDGESAYEVARRNGFSGTEQEWLASLVSKSENGLSAYQIAVIHGFTGSQADWLASLRGADGQPGANGSNGADGTNGLNGTDGKDGINGAEGASGANGTNGRTPEYTCRDNTTYWKYTDEDQSAYRPWFTVISCSQPPNASN